MEESFYDEYFRIEGRHWWFLGRRRIVLSLLSKRVGTGRADGKRVLDLGCGTGTMLAYLRRYGEATGVDADPRAVEFCHRRGEIAVRRLEGDELPFPNAHFDVVTALDVLEHIEDDVAAVREIERVLKPGGVLLATVPAYQWLWGSQDEISHHFRRYSAGRLRDAICAGGLAVERLTYFNSVLFPPIAAIRLARRLLPGPNEGEIQSDFEMTKAGRMNDLLGRVFGSEATWLRRRNLRFGVSLLAVASSPQGTVDRSTKST